MSLLQLMSFGLISINLGECYYLCQQYDVKKEKAGSISFSCLI